MMNSQRRVYPSDPENAMFDNAAFDGHPPNTEGQPNLSQTVQTTRTGFRQPNGTDMQRYSQPNVSIENHIYKEQLCSSRFAISVTVVVIVGMGIIGGLTAGIILQVMATASSSPSPEATESSLRNSNDKTTTTASTHVRTQASTGAPTCAHQGLWECNDGKCINPAWLCDSDHDCSGGEDENNCPTSCSSFQFECADGTCIPGSWQCDTESDCSGGDDELNCTARTCNSNEFTCGNGACVALHLTCDSYRDCSGGEDEENCEGSTTTPIVLQGNCSSDQRFCYDSAETCIEAAQWCDGTDHCTNGRDEKFCTCGRRPTVETSRRGSARIVGGREPTRGAWPWQVSLHDGGSHSCGASLVNTKFVVTAAHCVYDSPSPGSWTAYLGLHEQGETTEHLQSRDVDRIIIHERYDTIRTDFDIAVMELSSEVNITDHVYPVCLPGEDTEFPTGTNCWISGWGSIADGGVQATTLQEAEVPLVDSTVCDDVAHYDGQITDRMLCAGYDAGGIDACQGDSGGPLVCQNGVTWYLVGVTSWGDGCGQPNKPGIYADVMYLRDWVNTKLES